MKPGNPTQLKAFIKNLAAEKEVPAQLVMQSYMLERLLDRIATSRYHQNFIIKGGFLISTIIGIESRTTKDLDTSVKGLHVSHENLMSVFSEICNISLQDNISFELLNTEEIRELDEYMGIRVKMNALYPPPKSSFICRCNYR
jgi:predicted nucleotidyltransferase component of viral defense system